MRDDPRDIVEIGVGRRFLVGENVGGVEDVEALVLHRAHVEVADGDDVELIEVVFPPVDLLVPRHRQLQTVHRVLGFGQVRSANPDRKLDLAARHGREAIAIGFEVAGDEREQITWLGEGIGPLGPVPAIIRVARCDPVAVREKYGEARGIALQANGIF